MTHVNNLKETIINNILLNIIELDIDTSGPKVAKRQLQKILKDYEFDDDFINHINEDTVKGFTSAIDIVKTTIKNIKKQNVMTLRQMIHKGLCDNIVKIIQNPNDDCISCQIGEYWFYFIGSEDENMTPDEVYESYTKEELTKLILSAIENLEETETMYYKTFLQEHYG